MVLRYQLPPGHRHPMTDVIGVLVALDPVVVVRAADGRVVRCDPERVVALKAVPARPVRAERDPLPRTGRRRRLAGCRARAGSTAGWPATVTASPAAPTRRPRSATVGRSAAWTTPPPAARSTVCVSGTPSATAPLRLLIPDRLGEVPLGWNVSDEVVVMAADIDNLALPEGPRTTTVTDHPDPDWLALYRYRGSALPDFAVDVLDSVRGGTLGFGRIGAADSTLLAVARGSVTSAPDDRRWVGLTAVEVAEAHRRHGIGSLICGDMIDWGREHGATHACKLTGILGTFDIEVDLLAAAGAIYEPVRARSPRSACPASSGSASRRSRSLVPNVLKATGHGHPRQLRPELQGRGQRRQAAGDRRRPHRAARSSCSSALTGSIEPFTDDNGTATPTDDKTIPGLVDPRQRLPARRGRADATARARRRSPASPRAAEDLASAAILEFDDLRIGVQNFGVTFGGSATSTSTATSSSPPAA